MHLNIDEATISFMFIAHWDVDPHGDDGRVRIAIENDESEAVNRIVLIRQCQSRDKAIEIFVNADPLVKQVAASNDFKRLKNVKRMTTACKYYGRGVREKNSRVAETFSIPRDDYEKVNEPRNTKDYSDDEVDEADECEERVDDFRDAEEGADASDLHEINEKSIDTTDEDLVGADGYTCAMQLLMDFTPSTTMGPKHTPYGELRSQHLSIAMSFHEDETHPFRCQYGCGGKFDLFNRLVQHLRDDDPLECGDTHDGLRRQDGWDQISFYPEFMTNGAFHNKRVRDETGELVRPRRDFVEELRARGPHPKLRDLPDHFFAGDNILKKKICDI
ncbi:hypothetical protein BTUL_0134g00180 [Botrytis tulipae]|uniref:C2H2-type domain-containing protein n=1 Tax=Botrytis tulipae TaxID=87230 RepID=A0A4Z1EDU2_9HELO|nr:hypothetical protein BTUL_0134g00180 [Botrytis tulipae]